MYSVPSEARNSAAFDVPRGAHSAHRTGDVAHSHHVFRVFVLARYLLMDERRVHQARHHRIHADAVLHNILPFCRERFQAFRSGRSEYSAPTRGDNRFVFWSL
jgi:hypothetical protein